MVFEREREAVSKSIRDTRDNITEVLHLVLEIKNQILSASSFVRSRIHSSELNKALHSVR